MKFLVFQHVPHEHPGRIAAYCKEKGIGLNTIEFWKPYKIPSAASYDALIIMGGPQSVYDYDKSYPSKKDEVAAVKTALKKKIPVLGICLGSQLLAYALGAKVYPNMLNGKRAKEAGFFEVSLTEEGKSDSIFSGLTSPLKVLQWHGDAFDIPDGAAKLASSTSCSNQAFRHGSAYGLLFHLEFTPAMILKQTEIDRNWMHKDNEVNEEELIMQAEANESLMEKQFRMVFGNFLSQLHP